MTPSRWGLPPDLLDRAFPFHIALDPALTVLQAGPSLRRLCPELAIGSPLASVVDVVAPREALTFASCRARDRSLFLLKVIDGGLRLRGQMMYDEQADALLFTGSPWITDLASMRDLGLTLQDFAVSDNVIDYLLLLQTQESALAQATALAVRLQQTAAELSHQASHDALTGLPNRRLLADRFDQTLAAAVRSGGTVGLLLIDLDRFKEINDTFGHHYGDELLRQVGPRLSAVLREGDTVARLGGDEFAVLLPGVADVPDATVVAASLLAALAEPFRVGNVELDVEASIGVVLSGEHGRDPTTLMQHADIAMYMAKSEQSGVAAYDAGLNAHSPAKLALLGDLRRALDRGELVMHYQPIVECGTGAVVGAEALVRWLHPEHGLVFPDAFIPLAEHTGLIGPLTRHVLDLALRQVRMWRDAGRPLKVSVNLSARNLLDERLPQQVAQLLAWHGVPAGLLNLEVTESALMTDPARADRLLRQLSKLGVTIAVDDFGAGYTSLGQLRTLPVNELKIDRSFVLTMVEDPGNALIVRTLVELAHNLGLTVVAEGVESRDALAMLAGMGCDVGQGYAISRPLPIADFDRWQDVQLPLGIAALKQRVSGEEQDGGDRGQRQTAGQR